MATGKRSIACEGLDKRLVGSSSGIGTGHGTERSMSGRPGGCAERGELRKLLLRRKSQPGGGFF